MGKGSGYSLVPTDDGGLPTVSTNSKSWIDKDIRRATPWFYRPLIDRGGFVFLLFRALTPYVIFLSALSVGIGIGVAKAQLEWGVGSTGDALFLYVLTALTVPIGFYITKKPDRVKDVEDAHSRIVKIVTDANLEEVNKDLLTSSINMIRSLSKNHGYPSSKELSSSFQKHFGMYSHNADAVASKDVSTHVNTILFNKSSKLFVYLEAIMEIHAFLMVAVVYPVLGSERTDSLWRWIPSAVILNLLVYVFLGLAKVAAYDMKYWGLTLDF